MDLGTLIGIILGFALTIMSIMTSGGNLANYLDPGSALMVIGGSFSALMVANPLDRVLGIMKYVNHAFQVPTYEVERIISSLVNFSEKARREGLLALEDDLEEVEDEFLRSGIQLVVDGSDPDIIKNILYNDLNQIQSRHEDGIKVIDDWGKFAPAFGMVGTLAGLVAMMANLSDKDSIGSGMALALITTMYGSLFANLLFIPLKTKLEDRDKRETLVKEIMIEGILSIQSGDNPRILEQKLISFLPPDQREAVKAESSAG